MVIKILNQMSVAYINERRTIDVIVGRKEAIKARDSYFLGSVCGRGHNAMTTKERLDYTLRSASSGSCLACEKLVGVNNKMDQKAAEVKKRKDDIMFERELNAINSFDIG